MPPSTGLAKIAAAMANGGTFQGVKVLGEKGWETLHAKPTLGKLGFGSDDELHFTQVLCVFDACKFVQYYRVEFLRAGSAMPTTNEQATMVGWVTVAVSSSGIPSSGSALLTRPLF